ncbi:MAG: nitrilase-related carbon-nitrogen hydrolase [Ginsengibacter sp.]
MSSFIKRQFNGWLIPFFSSKGYSALNDSARSKPLITPYGKAGFLICNQAAIPEAAAKQVKKGAEFLMNMSNDVWFNDTYIVQTHYYYARLRAVESRKDIAINCNNGFSGLINASGEIVEKEKSTEPFVRMVAIQPNKYVTIASLYPGLFIYGCAIYIALIMIAAFTKRQAKNSQQP